MGEREKTRNIEDNKSKNQELLELMALCLSDMEWKHEHDGVFHYITD